MRLFNKFSEAIRNKVRYKILFLVLFPILLVMPIALALAINWGKQFTYQQLFLKVRTDLNISHEAFGRIRQDYLTSLERLAESYVFYVALDSGNEASIVEQIEALKDKRKFSFLNVIDVQNSSLVFEKRVVRKARVFRIIKSLPRAAKRRC